MYNFTLKYDGNSSVDATELSTSILNFARLVQTVSKDKIDSKQSIKVDITAFKPGSLDAIADISIVDAVSGVVLSSGAVLPVLSNILSSTVDIIDLYKFLRGNRPQKTAATNNGGISVTNGNGEVKITTHDALIHIGDTNITYNINQYLAPSKNDDRLSGQKIISDDGSELLSISKEEALSLNSDNIVVIQEVNIIGVIYNVNRETNNGKVDISGSKVSISFRQIANHPSLSNLISSLEHKTLVKIKGLATIDEETGSYKNIEIASCDLLQDPLLSVGDNSQR